MTTTRTVTKIQPMVTPIAHAPAQKKKRLTAGYGRVSTNEEEQQSSYEAQVEYYTNYIQANPEWEFVRVYADARPISRNTSTKTKSHPRICNVFRQFAFFACRSSPGPRR